MTVNKHSAIREWISSFCNSTYLHFESAEASPGIRALVPNYGDYLNKTDILGAKYKTYTFAFIGYEQIDNGTSNVNELNMQIFDDFTAWLELKKESREFPNFGTNCSEYEIELVQNMANMSGIDETGLAKYIIFAKINYKEE